MYLDPVETFAFYIVIILALFTVVAALADWTEKRAVRRERDQARAEARAKRMEGADRSESEDFSWQEPSRAS